MRRISAINSSANAGEPRASMTTTPWSVTTKPAFEMKLRFADEPIAASPCTNQTPGTTERARSALSSAARAGAAASINNAANQHARRERRAFTESSGFM
jgi:hypothetical protein